MPDGGFRSIARSKFRIESEFFQKSSDEKRLVYGWANVVIKKGETVTDHHDHTISIDEIQQAAHEYIINARVAKVMHEGVQIGEIVESFVFIKELRPAFKSTLDQEGWFIVMKIYDDETWERVKNGEFPDFSIGGTAIIQ